MNVNEEKEGEKESVSVRRVNEKRKEKRENNKRPPWKNKIAIESEGIKAAKAHTAIGLHEFVSIH